LPHQSRRQQATTTNIPVEYIEPGDLVYFYNPISHVGIYIGNGQMIDAPATGKNVRIAPVNFSKVVAVSRPG
jgi:cell wall-associated NlpC family hydrolase